MARKLILRQVPDDGDGGVPSVPEILAAIKKLYFSTTAATIERDFDRAIDLLKTIPSPEDRQRATVYMDGLAEMKREWRKPGRGR